MKSMSTGLHIHTDAEQGLKSIYFSIWYFWPGLEIIIENT